MVGVSGGCSLDGELGRLSNVASHWGSWESWGRGGLSTWPGAGFPQRAARRQQTSDVEPASSRCVAQGTLVEAARLGSPGSTSVTFY